MIVCVYHTVHFFLRIMTILYDHGQKTEGDKSSVFLLSILPKIRRNKLVSKDLEK